MAAIPVMREMARHFRVDGSSDGILSRQAARKNLVGKFRPTRQEENAARLHRSATFAEHFGAHHQHIDRQRMSYAPDTADLEVQIEALISKAGDCLRQQLDDVRRDIGRDEVQASRQPPNSAASSCRWSMSVPGAVADSTRTPTLVSSWGFRDICRHQGDGL
jgi:hypothetical protein